MNYSQSIITIAICALVTISTRFLPFLVFSGRKKRPAYIRYLGRALPAAIFAMLIVYSLRQIDITSLNSLMPQILAIFATIILYLWQKQMLLPIAGGTIIYMLLIQYIF